MNIYYVSYNSIGEILGLYNSNQHKVHEIPANSIQISQAQHSTLCRRPADFSVNVALGQMVDSGASIASVEAGAIPNAKRDIINKVAEGFSLNDTVYCADDVASAHATQCLMLSNIDPKKSFNLRVITANGHELKTVDAATLLQVVKGINKLREGI